MQVTLLLGGNEGNTIDYLQKAELQLKNRVGNIIQKSSYYESESWGFEAEQNFINQIIICETKQNPHEVLKIILDIENELGRLRKPSSQQYSSRTIDIDIIYCEQQIINTQNLIVPHPRLHLRKFALIPLCEIAENQTHPTFKKTNKELLSICDDTLNVKLLIKNSHKRTSN